MSNPATADKRPVSRGCCLFGALGLLAFAIVPCLAITLAMRQELSWKRGPLVEDRVWVVNEPEAAGLAYSAARLTSDQTATGGLLCARTTIVFFLWKGSGDNAQYCECYALTPDGNYKFTGNCSPDP